MRGSQSPKKRGAFKGPIRIPSSSPAFLFNDLVFPRISFKSLKFHSLVFSIPTAPAILTSPGRRAKPIQRFLQTIIRSAKQSGGRAATPVALVPKTPQTQHSPAAPQRTYR